MYAISFDGCHEPRSSSRKCMSPSQWKNCSTETRKKSTPAYGWMIRATSSPPTNAAIQRKIGVQIGMPVMSARKNANATDQWISRVARRWRMISPSTTTFSRCRATTMGVSATLLLMGFLLRLHDDFLRSVLRVVPEHGEDREERGDHADRPQDLLPHPHADGHVRVGRQRVQLRVVVFEHRDHRRPADARRVVQRRVRKPRVVQLLHPEIAEGDHVVLRAEVEAAGRTRFDARRLEPDFDAVDAERALRHLSGFGMELRHVERAPRRAVAAADARLRVHVDDAVRVLHDRARRRTRRKAARL